jgi:hypothetical protein
VIELVRHWYPNLQDKENMGHMWEWYIYFDGIMVVDLSIKSRSER